MTSAISSNVVSMLKAAALHIFGTGLLVSFLLFILNLFLLGSSAIKDISNQVTSKLGMYVYIKDGIDQTKTIINLKDELKAKNIVSSYVDKSEAWSGMALKNPQLIQNFQQYDIPNPLPNTLYVITQNEQQYKDANIILAKYKSIWDKIENVDGKSLKDQQQRAQNVINLTNLVSSIMYLLILVIGGIIVYFIVLGIQLTFQNFYAQIEVEKLIGAPYFQIKIPFFIQTLCVLLLAFGLAYIYRNGVINYLQDYVKNLFDQDITTLVSGYEKNISLTYALQFVYLTAISWVVSDIVLNNMIRKIGS